MATPALTRITEQDADQENERLFAPMPAAQFPKRSYAISVMSPAGFPITITLNDIIVPEKCPLLDIPIFAGQGKKCANSPSLDRILNVYGYVPGNVHVISNRANELKRDAQSTELLMLASRLAEVEVRTPPPVTSNR